MKNKKNMRIGKVLLIMTSVVLVAAISVYGTLAYLTATTAELTNTFQASSGISGEVQEPSYPGDTNGDTTYSFGTPVPKDPLIQNTGDNDMYVGLRLDFYLKAGNGSYVQVPYSTFEKYVTIKGDAPSSGAFNTDYWKDEYPSSNPPGQTMSKVFTYRPSNSYQFTKVLKDDNAADITSPVSNSTTYTSSGGDNTYPIFNSVQVKDTVNVDLNATNAYAPTAATTVYDSTNPTQITTAGFDVGPNGKTFNSFSFRIVITGQGVMADATNPSTNDESSEINNLILSDIKVGLGVSGS